MSTRFIFLLIITWGLSVAAIQAQDVGPQQPISPSAVSQQHSPELQTASPTYHIGQGDVVELNFAFTPEFNRTVTVRPDGFITRYRLKANARYFKDKPLITNFNLEFLN